MIQKIRESVLKNSKEKMVLKPSPSIFTKPSRKDRPSYLENLSFPKWMREER